MHRHCLHWSRPHGGWLLAALLGLAVAPAVVRGQPANAEALRKAVRTTLAERFPADVHRLRIRVERTGGDAETVQQPRIRFHRLKELPSGPEQVRVYRNADGRWQRAGWALLYVAQFDSVLVATRTIHSGDSITRRDVRVQWLETTRARGEPLSAERFEAHSALFATGFLREGRRLRRNDVRPPYAANTGHSVVVQYERAGLRFQLRCKAREPGFVGDVIRVYAPDTDAAYRARLIEPGLATWIETL